MSQIFVIGRVTADLQIQESANKSPYVRFDLAENIGYGESRRTQYYQVWAWGGDAKHLVKRKVKKGSLIWLSGSLELVSYTKKDGETKDKLMKVTFANGDFVPVSHTAAGISPPPKDTPASPPPSDGLPPVGSIDGDREALPD